MFKKLLGALSLTLGLAIVGWFLYNVLIAPTREFTAALGNPIPLVLPVAMVWMGWRWLRGDTGGGDS
jgi:hypothetical protein